MKKYRVCVGEVVMLEFQHNVVCDNILVIMVRAKSALKAANKALDKAKTILDNPTITRVLCDDKTQILELV